MIFIAHRGNLNGPDESQENNPDHIQKALDKGYDAEIDVWYTNGEWWLGHEKPTYKIDLPFLRKPGLWCHAKSAVSLEKMIQKEIHCFWHENDERVLTSEKYLWTFRGKELTSLSISVMPELDKEEDLSMCAGICTDFVINYQNKYSK